MRAFAVFPLLLAAACGDGPVQNEAAQDERAGAPQPGQWELASEVTGFERADRGAPQINTPVGTRATANLCVGEGAQLPTAFFSGEGFNCDYGTYYVRNGRINLTLNCRREGLSGPIPMTVNGSFEAGQAEFTRNARTILVGEGDVEIAARVRARRTGDCTAGAPAGNASRGG
jgi:hypothetical protein